MPKKESERDPLDRYYTDDRLAAGCLSWLLARFPEPAALLEPCAGGGAFGRAARRALPEVIVRGCDVDPDAAPGFPCDLVSSPDWRPDVGASWPVWIVTNPHYVGVYDTVTNMRDLQRRTNASVLALLLRATTLEQLMAGADRPALVAISDLRPKWGGVGGARHKTGDNCGSVLCVWLPAPTRFAELHPLPAWRESRKRRRA